MNMPNRASRHHAMRASRAAGVSGSRAAGMTGTSSASAAVSAAAAIEVLPARIVPLFGRTEVRPYDCRQSPTQSSVDPAFAAECLDDVSVHRLRVAEGHQAIV